MAGDSCATNSPLEAMRMGHKARIEASPHLAISCFVKVAQMRRNRGIEAADALYNAGGILQSLEEWEKSIQLLSAAIRAHSSLRDDASFYIGIALKRLTCYPQAESIFRNMMDSRAKLQLVIVLHSQQKLEEALDVYSELVHTSTEPLGPLYREIGLVYMDLWHRNRDLAHASHAESALRESALALELSGDKLGASSVLNELAVMAMELKQHDLARDAFFNATILHPCASNFNNLGAVLAEMNYHEQAIEAYNEALIREATEDLSPPPHLVKQCGIKDHLHMPAWFNRLYSKMKLAHWDEYDNEQRMLQCLVRGDIESLPLDPWYALSFECLDVVDMINIQKSYSSKLAHDNGVEPIFRPREAVIVGMSDTASGWSGTTLRIGVVSPSKDKSPALFSGVAKALEHVERAHIYCYVLDAIEVNTSSLDCGCDVVRSLAGIPASDASDLIRSDDIDCLIDPHGYTSGHHAEVLVSEPCDIQVSWQGFASTQASPHMHYILTDRTTTPPVHHGLYEDPVYLPGTFFASSVAYQAHTTPPSRQEIGLPDGFIFCSFNQFYKFTPRMMDDWASILDLTENAHMWILEFNGFENIVKEMVLRGINRTRIVTTRILPESVHVLAKRHCDVFLDTTPYGGHMVAAETLWAGIPMVTLPGAKMSSRVSSSIMSSMLEDDIVKLVAKSRQEYINHAVTLYKDEELLKRIRLALLDGRDKSLAFNMPAWGQTIERTMAMLVEQRLWQKWRG